MRPPLSRNPFQLMTRLRRPMTQIGGRYLLTCRAIVTTGPSQCRQQAQLSRRLSAMGASRDSSIDLHSGLFSRLRHKYQLATLRYGSHGLASFVSFAASGIFRSLNCVFTATLMP